MNYKYIKIYNIITNLLAFFISGAFLITNKCFNINIVVFCGSIILTFFEYTDFLVCIDKCANFNDKLNSKKGIFVRIFIYLVLSVSMFLSYAIPINNYNASCLFTLLIGIFYLISFVLYSMYLQEMFKKEKKTGYKTNDIRKSFNKLDI